MKIKQLFEQKPSPNILTNNSTSSSSFARDDQEMGSTETSAEGHSSFKNSIFSCFPTQIDLNPVRAVVGELVGTFMLVFCICGIIASTQILKGEVGLMEYAATAGFTVVIIIFSFGHISGAHVNPAVTIALASFGHFPWSRVPFYIIAQTIGSALATYVGRCVYGINPELMLTRPTQSSFSAFWVELIATFIIMFLSASMSQQASIGHLGGFVFGISIALAVLITGPISGGSLNPARSLGPAIVSWDFKDIWVYIVGPVIGAIAGVLMFHALKIQHRPSSTSDSSPDASLLAPPALPFGTFGRS